MIKKIICLGVVLIICLGLFTGCGNGYGYQFHYSVIDGNGEITVEDEAFLRKVRLCSESLCELECPENSHVIQRLGGKKGSHQLTFVATPDEGFQVKEWLFNGEIVEGNNTISYTAKVSSEQNYYGVIAVVFEPIPNNMYNW